MSRHRGDIFMLADRKNRLERARLDRQLKGFDKDCARHEFLIERQKRALVTKWQGVSRTTGHSEKALPPEGPHDNVYEKSKYNNFRLSEKRLMEWKVRERQLEKFLRQFQMRPSSSPAYLRSRPSSSRSEIICGRKKSSEMADIKSEAVSGRIRSAAAVLQHDGSRQKRRCTSAVSFSSRTEVISAKEDVDSFSEVDKEELNEVAEDIDGNGQNNSNGDKVNMLEPRERSFSFTSLPQQHLCDFHSNRRSTIHQHRLSEEEFSRSGVLEKPRNAPIWTELDIAEFTEKLKSSAKTYEAFVRTHSVPMTKFFITKDNVVMTNTTQRTCRELQGTHASKDTADNCSKQGNGSTGSVPKSELTPSTDMMSVSSVSSEEMADNVFVGCDERTECDTKLSVGEDAVDTKLDGLQNADNSEDENSAKQTDVLSDIHTQNEDQMWASKVSGHTQGSVQERTEVKTKEDIITSDDEPTVNCQTAAGKPARDEDNQKDDSEVHIPSVSSPMKKLSITDEKPAQGKGRSGSASSAHCRRHTCHQTSHPGPTPCNSDSHANRPMLFVRRENTDRSPHLLARRRQSSTVLPAHSRCSNPPRNPSSITSAMTVTSLLTKETRHFEEQSDKQSDIVSGESKTTLTKGNKPCSAHTEVKTRPSTSAHADVKTRPSTSAYTDVKTRPSTSAHTDVKTRPSTSAHTDVKTRPSTSAHTDVKTRPSTSAYTDVKTRPSTSAHTDVKTRPSTSAHTDAEQGLSNRTYARSRSASSVHSDSKRRQSTSAQIDTKTRPSTAHPTYTKVYISNHHQNKFQNRPQNYTIEPEDSDDDDTSSDSEEEHQSQWRRDLELEQPVGLRPSVSSLGTVIKAAMVFSKAARKRALFTLVEENNPHTHEYIRKERLRSLQSRTSVLNKIVSQFGDE